MKAVVVGTGSWGTALAQTLKDNGHDVTLYGRSMSEVDDINNNHMNSKFFPGVTLREDLVATSDISIAKGSDIVILSVPTIAIESVCHELNEVLDKKTIIVNTSKGFHPETNERMSEVIRHTIKPELLSSVVSLIGPSHAEEVVLRMLTTVVAVSLDEEDSRKVQEAFSNETFRVYRGHDEIGSEMGVALKNAIAVASGILSGLGYGDNTRAALMTRGLAEMTRFGVAMGGKQETFMGLTGIGDLIVTCTSVHSRNFKAGYSIGEHNSAQYFWDNNTATVEGVRTAKVIHKLSKEINVEMPIIDEIYMVLYEGKDPKESLVQLMLRDLKQE